MTLIAEQTVKAKPVEAALGRTSKGSEQVAVAFRILEGEDEGRQITWYGYFTEKTLERTLESLEYCGWAGDDLSNLSGMDKDVYLKIEHRQNDKGEVYAEVRFVNSGGGVALANRMDAGDAAAFAQRMRGAVLARKQAKGQAPAQPRNGAPTSQRRQQYGRDIPPPNDDDNIPF